MWISQQRLEKLEVLEARLNKLLKEFPDMEHVYKALAHEQEYSSIWCGFPSVIYCDKIEATIFKYTIKGALWHVVMYKPLADITEEDYQEADALMKTQIMKDKNR